MEIQGPTASRLASGHQTPVVTITITAVFTALVFLSTYLFQVPIPSTQGYFNLGDIMIFVSGLTFGPVVGGVSGGIGSALSDGLGGFGIFVPFTLVIKGLEGFVAGLISQKGTKRSILLLAWASGSAIMVSGYFLAESFFIALVFGASQYTGIAAGLGELPFNVLQVAGGGIVGIPVSLGLRYALGSTAFSSRLRGAGNGASSKKSSRTN